MPTTNQDEKLALGGQNLVLMPMNFKTIKKVIPLADRLKTAATLEQVEIIGQIIFLALIGANKDITQEFIDESLTFENANSTLMRVMEVSGLRSRDTGEAAPVTT